MFGEKKKVHEDPHHPSSAHTQKANLAVTDFALDWTRSPAGQCSVLLIKRLSVRH